MRLAEVKERLVKATGYRVSFEKREGGMLCGDHFPERDEPPIADLEDAWKLAADWAEVDPKLYVNIYVIQAWDWCPVDGYKERVLNPHGR